MQLSMHVASVIPSTARTFAESLIKGSLILTQCTVEPFAHNPDKIN